MSFRFFPLFFVFLLSACRGQVTWVHVVPTNYTGFLVIRYDCPGGGSLPQNGQTVTVPYSTNGTFCTTNGSATPWLGSVICRDAVGKSIPFVGQPWAAQGTLPPKALCGGEETRMNVMGKDFHLSIMWIGDPKRYAAVRNTPQYQKELEEFLNKEIGVPKIETQ
jgi:hypothetical protein